MKTKTGLHLLIRLARFKRQAKKLPPFIVPEKYKEAARLQGVTIR